MFHEHKTIEDMDKNVRGAKLTYEGVADLTPRHTSLESAINEAEMSKSEPRTKLEELVIEEEERVMIVIWEVLIKGSKSVR